MLKLRPMDQQQLETLLQQLPSAKAPAGMKDAIMARIEPARATAETSHATTIPLERGFLLLSLTAGFIALVFLIDLQFLNNWLIKTFTTFQLMFSQNILNINEAAGIAGKLPVYLLLTIMAIAALLLFEKLVLKKVISRINLL